VPDPNCTISSLRYPAVVALLAAVAGCNGEFDSLDTILQRRSAAMVRLPEEDHLWKGRYEREANRGAERGLPSTGVLTLDQSRSVALLGSPDIHAARARLDQALARIGEARAAYFPSVVLGNNWVRTFQTPRSRNRFNIPISQPLPDIPASVQDFNVNTLLQALTLPLSGGQESSGISRSFSEHTTTLSATWTLFDGFAREARLLSAKYTFGAAQMSLADAQRLLIQAVDSAYYQAQLGREQLRIARADAEFSRDQLAVAQKNRAAGKATQGDVLNFEVRWRAALADVVAATGLLENARTVLAELMGIDEARLPDELRLSPLVEETQKDLTGPGAEAWVQRALGSRPDLAQKDFEHKSKAEEVRIARAQFLPGVFLSGSYGFDRASNMAYSNQDQASTGAVEFRWQLFSGGLRTSQLRRTVAERLELAAELRRARQRVVSEVRQAVITLIDAQEQVRLQRLNLTSATENRRIVEAEYAAGKASLVRLNEAQRDLIGTEVGLARARIRLRQAWSDLQTAASDYPAGG
jgi:outer membrane protein TolC